MSQLVRLSSDFLVGNLTTVLSITIALLVAIWLWVQHHYSYWKRHNVPYIKPNFFFGNFKNLMTWKVGPVEHFQNLYNAAKDEPVIGIHVFHKPGLLIKDADLVKRVLVKDFNKFSNRYASSDPHADQIGADNLFFSKNPRWKQLRVKISPVFTSGKMKQMFLLIDEIGREFDQYLCNLPVDPKTNSTIQEVKYISSLFTTDVIAIAAFGVRANSLRNPNGDFRKSGQRIFHFTRRRAIELNSLFFLPQIGRIFGFQLFTKETTDFLRDTLYYVMEEREKSGEKRNDLIDILINFKKEAQTQTDKKHFVLEGDCLVAQAAVFFSAGFETSSATMSFALYELARHTEIQNRLREEIRDALKKCNGNITYEMITEMKFLHNVIQEVLRFYPPLPFLDRECTLDEDEENYSLLPHSSFKVPHGMPVYVPMSAIHKDPKYFPDPEKFDPDRFAPENRDKNDTSLFMAFGIGPHNCIGERFGLLQSKVGLVNFLRNHYVTLCEKSPSKMVLDPRAIIIQAQGGVYLNLKRDALI